ARGHAGARPPGALLPPRLARRMAHRAAVLLRARTAPRIRLVGDDQLVHQRLVEIAREDRVLCLVGAASDHLQFHDQPFTAGLTTTSRPRDPGTEPFTSSSCRS